MSLAADSVGAWRANVERASPIRAVDPLESGASLSPWQALMASSALAQNSETSGWRARIETGPAVPQHPVSDDPERIETAEARPAAHAAKMNDRAQDSPPDLENSAPTRPAKTPASDNTASKPEPPGLFEDGDFSLADLIDVVNPLQHIPIVSTIYRELTGDRIGHAARLAGGVLFMGPFGGLSALANIVLVEASGKDIGDHALALLKDEPASATTLAANTNTVSPDGGQKTGSVSAPAPIAGEKALAELLPPGAIPLAGRSVEFTQAALRPAALAPAPAPSVAAADDDLPPPPPPPGPIAGPGWKGFYSPPENPAASARVAPAGGQIADTPARRAYAPDPMAALAAKRTPGAMAGSLAAPAPAPGALAAEGGWFSDTMLSAFAKYEEAQRLRGPQGPEAARRGAVNIVN